MGKDEQPPRTALNASLSRRRLLGGLGAAAGLAAASAIPLAMIPVFDKNEPDPVDKARGSRQWAFVVDLRRCNNYRKCTEACQKAYHLPNIHEWTKTFEIVDKRGQKSYFPRRCMMCENAPCLNVCPTGATFRNDSGVVLVDQDRCIGCRTCMAACPYEARYFHYDDPPAPSNPLARASPEFPVPQQKGTVGKCVLCVSNTEKGKLPFCVEACPTLAFYIADLNSDVMTNGSETYQLSNYLYDNDAFRYKEELNTNPRVWYVPGHGQHAEY